MYALIKAMSLVSSMYERPNMSAIILNISRICNDPWIPLCISAPDHAMSGVWPCRFYVKCPKQALSRLCPGLEDHEARRCGDRRGARQLLQLQRRLQGQLCGLCRLCSNLFLCRVSVFGFQEIYDQEKSSLGFFAAFSNMYAPYSPFLTDNKNSISVQAGSPVAVDTQASLADGLTVPTVGVNAFATGAPLIDKVTLSTLHFTLNKSCICSFPSLSFSWNTKLLFNLLQLLQPLFNFLLITPGSSVTLATPSYTEFPDLISNNIF